MRLTSLLSIKKNPKSSDSQRIRIASHVYLLKRYNERPLNHERYSCMNYSAEEVMRTMLSQFLTAYCSVLRRITGDFPTAFVFHQDVSGGDRA
jgi:hypothetical protein